MCDESHVLGLVLVRHRHVLPVGNETARHLGTKNISSDGEGQFNAQVLQGVLQEQVQALVVLLVEGLQVREADGYAENVLVEGPREMHVKQHIVANSLGHQSTDEPEIVQMLRIGTAVRIRLVGDAVGT